MPHPCIPPGIDVAAGCGCRPDKWPQRSGPAKSRQRWPHSSTAAFAARPLRHKAWATGWLPAHGASDRWRLTSGMRHPFLPSRGPAMCCVRSPGWRLCLSPLRVPVFLELRPSRAPHPVAIFILPPWWMPKAGGCGEQLNTPRSIPASHSLPPKFHTWVITSQDRLCRAATLPGRQD